MKLQELIQQRQDVQCSIYKCLDDEVTAIKLAAEEMIECATNIKGQGYSLFIRSRQDFLDKIDQLHQQIEASASINSCTTH